MPKRYILTLMAANRVGIMSAVTTAMAELGGDLVEVSQTVMQRFFTIILAAEFPEHRAPDVIVDHLRDVCRPYNVEVALKDPAVEVLQDLPQAETEKYVLTVTGQDTPGIIRQISTRLAEEGIDIVDFYAVRQDAEHSFMMVMELAVPPGVNALAMQQELEQLGSSVGLWAAMQHENIFVATNDARPVRVRFAPLASK